MLQSPSQNGKQREYRFQHFLKNSRNLKRNLHNFHFPTRPKCSAESIAVEGAEETYAPQRLGAFWLLLLCRTQRVRTVNGGPFPLASIHNSAPNEEIAGGANTNRLRCAPRSLVHGWKAKCGSLPFI
ncbi:Hypothetical_protein [Hexamita inflata]|uniref:Hypothetical_protein n=1 Tax=Hexamita inflata TaxID=28002 RepID=A0AA86N5H1_9EUKA|nr:Hypothetical protein HINF_LOCUS806 [Hexamita inflata]